MGAISIYDGAGDHTQPVRHDLTARRRAFDNRPGYHRPSSATRKRGDGSNHRPQTGETMWTFNVTVGALAALTMALGGVAATAQTGPVKIGVLGDQSSAYSDLGGKGSVIAAQMAIEDFGKSVLGKPIEIVSADHQNKPEIGANIARGWYDRDGVTMITDLTNSAVAIAVQNVSKEKKKIDLVTSTATTRSPTRRARLTASTGPSMPMRFRSAPPRRWSSKVARLGISSPPTTPSATISRTMPRASSRRSAVKSWAPPRRRSTPPISHRSCWRRRHRAPMSSASPIQAPTPPIR